MSKQVIEIMRFNVGSHQFGVERHKVQSIQHGNLVHTLSTDNGKFKAILRTNEGELPVLRLADFIGKSSIIPIEQQRVLILRGQWGLWCLLIDTISQVTFVPASKIRPLPGVTHIAFADSVFIEGKTVILILSPDKINPNRVIETAPPLRVAPPIQPIPTESTVKGQLVLFQLPGTEEGDSQFSVGLTPKQINEVLRNTTLQTVPSTTTFLKGMITWRGRLVPVMDLGERLGLGTSDKQEFKKQDRIVIAHGKDSSQLLAFYSDSTIDVLHLPAPHKPSANTTKIEKALMHGAADYAGQTVIIPHIANIMAGTV